MGKKVLAIVVALVATQLLSGCYFLRELNWNKDLVPKDENSTKATIGLQPSGDDDENYFFMGFAGKGAGFTVGRPVFDSGNVTGQKQKLIADNDIGDFVDCPVFATAKAQRGPGPGALVWRTENEVSGAKETKFVDAKLKAKRTSEDQGGFAGVIVSGEWIDDGDGVPEDPGSTDDEFDCTGEMTTSFLMKGNGP